MLFEDSDLRLLLDATTALVADPPRSLDEVLELVRSVIPCDSVSFNDMTLATGDFRYRIAPADEEALAIRLKPYYDLYAHEHPLIVEWQSGPAGRALRFCDAPGGDRITETDLYRHFYEPFNIRYQLVIQLPSPPDVVVGYALNRAEAQGEYSERDVAMLTALGPHLALHHRVVMNLERSRAVDAEAGRAGWSVATVRSDGVVEAVSPRAISAVLTPGQTVPGELTQLLPTQVDLDQMASTTHDVVIGGDRWRCIVSPVAVGPTVLSLRRLGDEAVEQRSLVDLGLTPRQAEVAVALAQTGGTNAQLARSLNISEGTVKKHLESIFRLLGVDSRAAAVVALATMVERTE